MPLGRAPRVAVSRTRSRCQVVRFGLAPAEELAQALVRNGAEPALAKALARASGGRPGLALSWAADPSVLEARREIVDLFVQIAQEHLPEISRISTPA